jgi:hypothetical protein
VVSPPIPETASKMSFRGRGGRLKLLTLLISQPDMAKKTRKLQPAVETLTFVTPDITGGGQYNGSFYIDLAKAASIVNRRGYRQGRQWMVAGFTLVSAGTGSVSICKLPINWVTANSWEKSFRMWDKQQKDAVASAGAQSTMAAYRDYKVSMTPDHVDALGGNRNLLPIDADGNTYAAGEWQQSFVVVPNAGGSGASSSFNLHICGPDKPAPGASKGLIEAYAASRARPDSNAPDENNPQDGLFAQMFDIGETNDAVIGNATDRNDDQPYDSSNYPGGATNGTGPMVHAYTNIIDSSAGASLGVDVAKAQGGCFPCGLIRVDWTETENNANLVIQVHMVPGGYRGYLAPPMTEL